MQAAVCLFVRSRRGGCFAKTKIYELFNLTVYLLIFRAIINNSLGMYRYYYSTRLDFSAMPQYYVIYGYQPVTLGQIHI